MLIIKSITTDMTTTNVVTMPSVVNFVYVLNDGNHCDHTTNTPRWDWLMHQLIGVQNIRIIHIP